MLAFAIDISLKYKSLNGLLKFILFILISTPVALRGELTGTDTDQYIVYISQIIESGEKINIELVEPLFGLIVYAINYIDSDPQFILAIMTYASIFALLYSIYKYSCSVFVSLIIFFGLSIYLNYFNAHRQMMSLSIAALGYGYLPARSYFKFICVVITAGLVHWSSFMLMLLVVVAMLPLSKLFLILSFALSQICMIVPDAILYIIKIFYSSASFFSTDEIEYSKYGVREIAYTGALLFFIHKYEYISTKLATCPDSITTAFRIILYAMLLRIALSGTGPFVRLALAAEFFIILAAPSLLAVFWRSANSRIGFYIIGYWVCLGLFMRSVVTDSNGVLPYESNYSYLLSKIS